MTITVATAIPVTAPYPDDARPHADALVTDRPGLALGILTADCTPVLFAEFMLGATIEHACEGCHKAYWYPNEVIPEIDFSNVPPVGQAEPAQGPAK